jgi:uncharacterized protein YjbI with pentapeptide repeats
MSVVTTALDSKWKKGLHTLFLQLTWLTGSFSDFTPNAWIHCNVDIQNVDFQNVEFQNVEFQNVDFQNVDFQNVDFQNANLQNVDFQNANF